MEVKDFGASWRDGVAFLALIDAIKANLVNLAELKKTSNRQRLETAFDVAESKLGIAKLLTLRMWTYPSRTRRVS